MLLPVRLETRFVTDAAGPALLVRIYPDEIHVDSHRAQLSDAEVAAGTVYAQQISAAGGDVEAQRVAFEDLAGRVGRTPSPVCRFGSPRGRCRRRTTPSTRWAPAACRSGGRCAWLPRERRGGQRDRRGGARRSPARARRRRRHRRVRAAGGRRVGLVDFKLAVNAGMAVRVSMPDDGGLSRWSWSASPGRRSARRPGADRLADSSDGHRFGAGLDVLGPGTPTNNTGGQRSAWTRRPDARELFDAKLAAVPAAPDVTAPGGALGIVPDTLAGTPHQGASSTRRRPAP